MFLFSFTEYSHSAIQKGLLRILLRFILFPRKCSEGSTVSASQLSDANTLASYKTNPGPASFDLKHFKTDSLRDT